MCFTDVIIAIVRNTIFYLGSLVDKRNQIGIGPFGYSLERIDVVDFLTLLDPEYAFLYVRNPKETFDWEVYIKPLRKEAWIGVCAFCLITPLLFCATINDCKISL